MVGIAKVLLTATFLWSLLTFATFAQSIAGSDRSIAVIDQTRLFEQSLFGQRVAQEFQSRSAELSQENTEIAAQFQDEEAELVEQRKTVSSEEFQILADDFDTRVKRSRTEQDTKLRELNEFAISKRAEFFAAMEPILLSFLQERGIDIVLDRGTVILASEGTDITTLAIELANQRLRLE